MPPYWRQRRRTWRRRRYFPTWRTRRIIQRRWRKRRRRNSWYWRRVRRRLYKLFYKRKLKKIRLYQFQPKTIRRCTINGNVCLFQGSPERMIHNYVQSIYAYVPQDEPGGGGWTIMIESLASLWEDWEHLKNTWSTSNAGLPLVRVLGFTLTFFQAPTNDYIVEITNCYPMTDTIYTHADLSPSRMLLKRNVIKVPSRETQRRKKPYKRVRIGPPSQIQNKWYFQKEICDLPLIMIAATSVDFRYSFCASNCKSNNLSLTCLNPQLFQRHDFGHPSETLGYFPRPGTYLYSFRNGTQTKPTSLNHLIYLGNTKDNTPGKTSTSIKSSSWKDWGNPFYHHYIDGSYPVLSYMKPPSQLEETDLQHITALAEDMFITVRYNPEKDTGKGNTIYLVPNYTGDHYDIPQNPNLKLDGFPLYNMVWGFTDWVEKTKAVQNLNTSYIFCIQSDMFNEKLTAYVPVTKDFIEGFGPYETKINRSDQQHWHPKVRFQDKAINDIGLTGPGCCRSPYGNYVQAKMNYKVHLKFGGCPKTLEKPYDPCSQPTWNYPRNINEGLSIQNPNTNPQTELQEWDWRRDYIKQTAIQRIKKYTEPDETLQIVTDSKHNLGILRQTPPTSSSESDTETEEDHQTPIETQILQLKLQQHKLRHRIKHRLSKSLL
nr:MAG: ORF1 [TTV-like mini virus]